MNEFAWMTMKCLWVAQLEGGGRGGIQKLQIDGCFMFMYKVLFLVEAYLRSDQLVTSH